MSGKQASVLLMAIITTVCMIIMTFGEFALGQLGQTFTDEYGIPISTIGMLSAVMFASSGLAALPIGWLVDKFPARRLIPFVLVFAAVSFSLFTAAQSAWVLFVVCGLIGVGMAASIPLTNRAIVQYMPRDEFPRVVGWRSIGPQAGAVLSGIAFGGLSGLVEWRLIVFFIAALMVAFAIWVSLILKRRTDYSAPTLVKTAGGTAATAHGVPEKSRPIVWWLLPYGLFSGGVIASLGAYIPLFAIDEIGMTGSAAALALSVVAGASVVARFLWIRLLKDRDPVKILMLAGLCGAVTPLLLVVSPGLGQTMFWIAAVLVGATSLGAIPLTQIVLIQCANPQKIGTVTAWNNIATSIGLTVQPWLISIFINHVGFAQSWIVMAIGGFASFLVMVAFMMVQRWRGQNFGMSRFS